MIQALSKLVTFDEFIEWYPDNPGHHYELHNGVIVEMPKPTGKHSEIAGFLGGELFDGEYQISRFRGDDRIVSGVFPELNLTVNQVFNAT
ncbi:MAG TPA: hypothetical protein DDZ80_11610 [Cyanobacteria bacterium UBA8803]|nr:hypothetical protein [Cyanobacteria bacterium UBA9273]HBL59132.1 hypothetical protein [Cyanobacteria bacterium UBA8803]